MSPSLNNVFLCQFVHIEALYRDLATVTVLFFFLNCLHETRKQFYLPGIILEAKNIYISFLFKTDNI